MVTMCTASLTFSNSTFCPPTVFMCFVWISGQTALISLYNINWLVFITQTECVHCAVGLTHQCCFLIFIYRMILPEGKKTGNIRYVYRNTESRSRNHCCCGKAINVTYYACVFIALGIQHAMFMCHIASVTCPTLQYFLSNTKCFDCL